jgi:D-glycero-alpha-D-manno-heptose-7-phosphate kinase
VTRSGRPRAPTRIDLGGGWTDVPPYCEREGGFVCNVAITRYARVCLTNQAPPTHIDATDASLVRAALKRTGVQDTFVELKNDFPVAAGLGGSSAASAALLSGLDAWRDVHRSRVELAEEGRRIEVEELGIAGGRQDHYAATHGGALALTFATEVSVRQLSLPNTTRRELPARSLLIYTGQSRISGDTITAVLSAYENGDVRVVGALKRMREIAEQMASALEGGDLDAVGAMLDEHWTHQRSLNPSIPTQRIDEIIARARRSGALGAKAMGASGGGCVLVIARAGHVDEVREAIRSLGELLDFEVDEGGVTIESIRR